MIPVGIYENALISDYGIKTTKDGLAYAYVSFQVKLPTGGSDTVDLNCHFKTSQSTEISLEALSRCGLQDGADIPKLAKGVETQILDTSLPYKIKVSSNEFNGRSTSRVDRILSAGSEEFSGEYNIDEEAAEGLLGGLNLTSSFAALKEKKPKKLETLPDAGF